LDLDGLAREAQTSRSEVMRQRLAPPDVVRSGAAGSVMGELPSGAERKDCDFRIAARKSAKFGLNEVPIGIPMPTAHVEIIKYALGEPIGALTSATSCWRYQVSVSA
jgi:hypothetical protein